KVQLGSDIVIPCPFDSGRHLLDWAYRGCFNELQLITLHLQLHNANLNHSFLIVYDLDNMPFLSKVNHLNLIAGLNLLSLPLCSSLLLLLLVTELGHSLIQSPLGVDQLVLLHAAALLQRHAPQLAYNLIRLGARLGDRLSRILLGARQKLVALLPEA